MIIQEEKQGFFLVNKPVGWSSHKVVSFIKKSLNVKKVGHAGTLDPFASGLLIVLINKYTKKFDFFKGLEKQYEAVICLGKVTDTYDIEGNIVKEYRGKIFFSQETIRKTIGNFEGEILQNPPVFSALKINGVPAYRLARKGKDVKLSPRKVHIKKIVLKKYKYPYLRLSITCSSGTYIRSLAFDIGESLGVGAYLEKLTRTKIGDYDLDNAKNPEDIIFKDLKLI